MVTLVIFEKIDISGLSLGEVFLERSGPLPADPSSALLAWAGGTLCCPEACRKAASAPGPIPTHSITAQLTGFENKWTSSDDVSDHPLGRPVRISQRKVVRS